MAVRQRRSKLIELVTRSLTMGGQLVVWALVWRGDAQEGITLRHGCLPWHGVSDVL